MDTTSDGVLTREVNYFHRYLFKGAADPRLIQYYAKAHKDLDDLTGPAIEQATIDKVIRANLNPLSIERWVRRCDNRHLLTRKLLLLLYLCECDGDHTEWYQPEKTRFEFWLVVPFWSINAIFDLVWGKILTKYYALV